ncbi:hypothetical protein FF124_13275 [Martelella lutilitoris]|uniref:Uncharacterized protein n=1 Tax=Martelella lutilitoris TaxID=2583532 RepID=A0A5C4JPC7_9HYPH|nr:hypothetical protein [Martelella lutilitoris]TNB47147.1 hypothetical protein FF124_13275 [Martelella lutilitoris]
MLETTKVLENEIDEIVNMFIESTVRSGSPVLGEVARYRMFEGHQTAILREDGDKEEEELHLISGETSVPAKTLLYGSLEEILGCFLPVAKSLAADQSKLLFELIDRTTEKTGNVINGKKRPFSPDLVLEMLDKIEIEFDANGKPRMPTLVVGETMAARAKEVIEASDNPEFIEKFNKIKKKEGGMACSRI